MGTTRDFQTDFDHFDPAFIENMPAITADLRAHCPVAYGKVYGGFWVFSRHDDVIMALRDEKTFSSKGGIAIPWIEQDIPLMPVETDPPEHTKYRSLLASWLVARKANEHEAVVRQLVTKLINGFIEDGSCDFFSALAIQLTASIIAPVMGFEPKEWPIFTHYIKQVIATTEEENVKARHSLIHYMFREMERRRVKPRDDFLTTLVMARPDGKPLDGEEIISLTVTFLMSGLETTATAICNLLIRLAEHPDARQRFIADPSPIPLFVDECLRYDSPLQYIGRNVTKDMVIHNQELKAGEKVFLFLGSANRDEAYFPDADQFIFDRQSNRHMAFGYGIHFCVGAHLARLQMRVVMEEVLRRLPDYQLHGPVERYLSVGQIYGVTTLPIRFTPGKIEELL